MKTTLTHGLIASAAFLLARAIWVRSRRASFKDRVVLITGGTRGLGLELASHLARQNVRLAICGRDPREFTEAEKVIRSAHPEAKILSEVCDISDPVQAERLIQRVTERYGQLDVIINNAGNIQVGPIADQSRKDFEEALKTNFWGAYNVTLSALPALNEKNSLGRIININSIGGVTAIPHLLPYCVSKSAMLAFSQGLQRELRHSRIRVTTIVPGLMRTGSFLQARFKGDRRKELGWFAAGASLPLLTVSAPHAARRIIRAARNGEMQVTLGAPAKCLRIFSALFPSLTSSLLYAANKTLPRPLSKPESKAVEGRFFRSSVSHRPYLSLGERAARRLNEG